jgi:hypothetical protein
VVELPFLGERDVDRLHHLLDQRLRQRGVAGHLRALDADPVRILDRAFVFVGHADRERRHVVHEEVAEVLGADDDQRVRPGGAELFAEAVERGVDGVLHGRVGQMRAAGDAGRVAADARENKTHTPATFSSISVVIA